MNEIEKTIRLLSDMKLSFSQNYIQEAFDVSIEAFREKAEREKGCAWCQSDWTDNFTVIDDDFGQPLTYRHVKFCPMCGKRLEEHHEAD